MTPPAVGIRLADESTDERLKRVTVGELASLTGPVILEEYNADWPKQYAREAERIRSALGDRTLLLEHVGSTAVPELAAKPVIDILLVVANSADEPAYVPALEAAGYVLRIREPDWHEHRVFNGPDIKLNLHVFSRGSTEIERMLRFRDHLRSDVAERQLYEKTKRALAKQSWKYMQNYADAKSEVVQAILERSLGS